MSSLAHSPSAHTQPGSATDIASLPALVGPAGHDAYCHVCWEPVYRLWVAEEAPDYTRCGIGDYTAQTCPNATGPARLRADIARLKADGLWPTTASAVGMEARSSRRNAPSTPEQGDGM